MLSTLIINIILVTYCIAVIGPTTDTKAIYVIIVVYYLYLYFRTPCALTKSSLNSQDQNPKKYTPNFPRNRFLLNTFYFVYLGLSSSASRAFINSSNWMQLTPSCLSAWMLIERSTWRTPTLSPHNGQRSSNKPKASSWLLNRRRQPNRPQFWRRLFLEIDSTYIRQYDRRHKWKWLFDQYPPYPPILQPGRLIYFSITANLDALSGLGTCGRQRRVFAVHRRHHKYRMHAPWCQKTSLAVPITSTEVSSRSFWKL